MQRPSRSQLGWAFLLLALLTAAFLRFWQLGDLPPGLYRDEAFNGLDALDVLRGDWALFFTANNGREPAYIYLTAVSISLFGRTALAVRFAAALVGTLTTWIVFLLARDWFGRWVGVLAAWLWAITLWPMHLSRIGLRPILLVPLLALTFWLATLAYKKEEEWLWFAAGGVYALSFYTYLAARATPAIGVLIALFLVWRGHGRRLWPGLLWFGLGAALLLAPLAYVAVTQPELELFGGRTGQVSVFNPAINGGDVWGTLARHIGRGLGLFFWRGDDILRHNPAHRPVFDVVMAIPFLWGVVWCLRRWRRPQAALLLMWMAVMLLPTILAEDTPHFLRAVGLLPAILIFPAIGLSQIASCPKLARLWPQSGTALTIGLLAASLGLTFNDYFLEYGRQPDTAYLFEAAARDLAEQINAEASDTKIFVDERFWDGWPSVPFLVNPKQNVTQLSEADRPAAPSPLTARYLWPYDSEQQQQFLLSLEAPAQITADVGLLARGDLEPEAYPLYVRYAVLPASTTRPQTLANFNNDFELLEATAQIINNNQLHIDLHWSLAREDDLVRPSAVVFVHVVDLENGRVVGQSDSKPAQGFLPTQLWQPGLSYRDQHFINLDTSFQSTRHQIVVGLYPEGNPNSRLPLLDAEGNVKNDIWEIKNIRAN